MWGYFVMRLLNFVQAISAVFAWTYSKMYCVTIKKRMIPPIENRLFAKKASELAEMIRERKVTSTAVVQAFMERIQTVNPIINSVVQDRFKEALGEARQVDKMIEDNPDAMHWAKTKPLLGVPLTVKETIPVKGMSNNGGRLRPREHIAMEDCLAVKNLRESGAIPIAVTNTPELCSFWESFNYSKGVTKNPYDNRKTAGGSSGGEAALMSTGGSVIGIGSDIAGSGRLPPAFCGTFGHKPTSKLIDIRGHMPESTDTQWDRFLVFAPLARSASDLSLVLRCAAPQETAQLRLEEPVDLKTLKIFYMDECVSPLLSKVDIEIKNSVHAAAYHFIKYGVEAKKVAITDFDKALEASMVLMLRLECPQNVFQRSDDPNDWTLWTVLGEIIRKMFGCGRVTFYSVIFGIIKKYFGSLSLAKVEECERYKEQLTRFFEDLLGDNGVLILPVFPSVANHHFEMYGKFLNSTYLCIFNLLEMPVTACPVGFNRNGMPIGVQIAANKYQDRLTLAVANELENAYGGWIPPGQTEEIWYRSSAWEV